MPPKQNVSGNLGKFHKCHPKITSSERHFNQFYRLAMVALRGDGHSIVSLVAEVLVRLHEAATLFRDELQASYMMTWSLWGGWGWCNVACGK